MPILHLPGVCCLLSWKHIRCSMQCCISRKLLTILQASALLLCVFALLMACAPGKEHVWASRSYPLDVERLVGICLDCCWKKSKSPLFLHCNFSRLHQIWLDFCQEMRRSELVDQRLEAWGPFGHLDKHDRHRRRRRRRRQMRLARYTGAGSCLQCAAGYLTSIAGTSCTTRAWQGRGMARPLEAEFRYFWPRRRCKALENVFPWETKLIPSDATSQNKSWYAKSWKKKQICSEKRWKKWDNEVRMVTSERFTLRGTLTISQAASGVLAFFNLSFCSCTKPRSCKPFSSFTCQLVLVLGLKMSMWIWEEECSLQISCPLASFNLVASGLEGNAVLSNL